MKKVLGLALGLILSVSAFAGDNFAALVAEKAQGGICVYAQKFFASPFGKMALEKIKADENYKDMADFEAKTGFKLEQDLQRLVITLVDADAQDFYAVLDGKFDAKKIEEVISGDENTLDFKAVDRNGARQLSWKDKKNSDGETIFLAFTAPDKAVISSKEKSLDAGVAVVSGKAANAAKTPLFAKAAAPEGTAFIEGAFAVSELAKNEEKAKDIKTTVVNVAELTDKKLCLNVNLAMINAEKATEMVQTILGMKTLIATQLPVLNSATAAAKDADVTIKLALSEKEILDAAKMAEEMISGGAAAK